MNAVTEKNIYIVFGSMFTEQGDSIQIAQAFSVIHKVVDLKTSEYFRKLANNSGMNITTTVDGPMQIQKEVYPKLFRQANLISCPSTCK